MKAVALDHMVLVVEDVEATCRFYGRVLGMEPLERAPGWWVLPLGDHMISVRQVGELPDIAAGTTPGSGNFCVLTDLPIDDVVAHLSELGIAVVEGPVERLGAVGPMMSVYFHDPDGNLVEVAEPT